MQIRDDGDPSRRYVRGGAVICRRLQACRCKPFRSALGLTAARSEAQIASCPPVEPTANGSILPVVCTENLIRVDDVMKSPKLAE